MSEQIQSNNNVISIEKNVVDNNLINTRNVYNDNLFNCEDVVNNISLINRNIIWATRLYRHLCKYFIPKLEQ